MGDVQHSAKLMRLSAEHRPRLIQTAIGGKRMAINPRKMSDPHIVGSVGVLVGRSKGSEIATEDKCG